MAEKKHRFRNKKEEEAFDDFLRSHIDKILTCGDLSHFYMRKFSSQAHSKKDLAMWVSVDHKYLEFDLTYIEHYAACEWHRKNYSELVRTLCHEVTHILTLEPEHRLNIKGEKEYYFERLTEHTSRWLYENYKGYMKTFGIDIATGQSKELRALIKRND